MPPSSNLELMQQIEGFDETLFSYALATLHPYHIGEFYLFPRNGFWSRKYILESLQKQILSTKCELGEVFLEAKQVEILILTDCRISDVIWKMKHLKELTLRNIKEVELKGKLKIRKLVLKNCKKLTIDSTFDFKELEEVRIQDTVIRHLSVLKSCNLKRISIDKSYGLRLPKDGISSLNKWFPSAEIVFE